MDIALATLSTTPETYPYTPQQVGSVYLGTGAIPFGGAGKKLGIITCFYYKNLQADLNKFIAEFGLAPKTLVIHNYGTATDSGWATETCLDTQWSHWANPNSTTYVFMSKYDSISSIVYSLQQAVSLGMDVISMSFGSDENQSTINAMEPIFSGNPNIIFLAASGDNDTVSYPSSSPNVISVGGTILTIASNGVNESKTPSPGSTATPIVSGAYTKLAESNWYTPDGDGSGHGISQFFARPSYQSVHNPSQYRSTPDVSAIAASPDDSGVFIYCSVMGGWLGVEGTSLATPLVAGLITTVLSRRTTKLTRVQILTYLYGLIPSTLPIDVMVDGSGYVSGKTIQALVGI
jgi:subtilase family serine protease